MSVDEARVLTQKQPQSGDAWKHLGAALFDAGDLIATRDALQNALSLSKRDHQVYELFAKLEIREGNDQDAITLLQQAITLNPDSTEAHFCMAMVMHDRGQHAKALEYIERADKLLPNSSEILGYKGIILYRLHRYEKAFQVVKNLLEKKPQDYRHWNTAGNIKRDLGCLVEADTYYRKSVELSTEDAVGFSNRVTALHYRPDVSREEIFEICKQWEDRYASGKGISRPVPKNRDSGRRLRLGLMSDGFRRHPVGMMITSVLEKLSKTDFELFAYTTNNAVDEFTRRIQMAVDHWIPVVYMSNDALVERLQHDEIDILIDLCGHNTGTRMQVVAREPAPIIVKWVGGLINTTGLRAFDYLITDNVESPEGEDEFYTEKLIRLPDDYICYVPPRLMPDLVELPALHNGYITLGCFNNPIKVNEVVLEQWAKLMHELPNSHLVLKGHQYQSDELRQRVESFMLGEGIASERLSLEGPAPHMQLLAAYNRIDIALDPWPYSGGLTTCEAMLMGVPVVTMPGPTFAGRHSATHLVNAGMPELVVSSWEEYRKRVRELAADLESLSTIRKHLRHILLQSPVCDAERFARHFNISMRAIWQRYCEGKAPAGLNITQEGDAWFADATEALVLKNKNPESKLSVNSLDIDEQAFNFELQGKIVVLDHGGSFVSTQRFTQLNKLGLFSTVAFDPLVRLSNNLISQESNLQCFPSVALGDGTTAMLHVCLDPALSSVLEPLPLEQQLPCFREGARVIAKLPIATYPLDQVAGLTTVDWLILDNQNDNFALLENGKTKLTETLVVQVRVDFLSKYKSCSDLKSISTHLSELGFEFYRFDSLSHESCLPNGASFKKLEGTKLVCANAVFIPNKSRISSLTDNQRNKLALIIHAAYGGSDLVYSVLQQVSPVRALDYLESQGILPPSADEKPLEIKKKFVHICFNSMHVQQLVILLAEESVAAGFVHEIYVEKSRSVAGYDVDLSCNPNAVYFDALNDIENVYQEAVKSEVAVVFFHGIFFDWQKVLVKRIGGDKKIVWVMWGGDLYNPIRAGQPMLDVVQDVDVIASLSNGDYDIFSKSYPAKPKIDFSYAVALPFERAEDIKEKDRLIVVGNSGDESNCHIEIIEELAKKTDISDYCLVFPLSYNLTGSYHSKIISALEKFELINQSRFLYQLLPVDEYFSLIARAEFFIAAHHRHQALGNLLGSLYFGNKTVLRKKIKINGRFLVNPGWDKLTREFCASLVDYDVFASSKTLGDIEYPSARNLDVQRSKILEIYGREFIRKKMKDQLLKALEV